ncbi:helicase-exonuclease AddAB subunit AddA [Pectinatus haikarae]|uniref:ATP-dependent helicase/nuclease subunit A n=1 Tax=Pectinatus haikarae TaxID=349096 RepID=A0ABT9Y7S5_9FIRM|nr:helicase-exonuclease AddAB subunit AddA [Pectinatus haikarae]MDQ0203888.1 ATP-dependent helicase/nuclease subunit A [Pectinatus haikarae]
MAWTREQEEAISTRGKNILVAAAAGSGKTAVLVERTIRLVLDDNVDINEILIVTFTNAAAAEMRERIGRRLEEQLTAAAEMGAGTMMKKLERQLVLMNAASISTLHSFCQGIIRHYFHEIDIDPKFRLAGEQEINLLKQDVLSELIEQQYENENNELFLHFADSYGNERGDAAVYEIIISLYEYAMSQPFPEQWLKQLPEYLYSPENGGIDDTKWAKILKTELELVLDECMVINSSMEKAASQCGCEVKAIQSDLSMLSDISDGLLAGWETLYAVMEGLHFAVMRLPSDMPESFKEYLKSARQREKDVIGSIVSDFFQMPPKKLFLDLHIQKENMQFICGLTEQFLCAFGKAKHERVIADFNDLEHFALRILADERSTVQKLIPTEAAAEMNGKYKEVMVDEYQDTNGVQEAIISLIAGAKTSKFLVGDVKQSIYRFRLAEPELFMEKYRTYPLLPEQCKRIDLSKNFRSRENILQAVNFIFSQTMTEKTAEVNYSGNEALVCGLAYPQQKDTLDDTVELILLDKDNTQENDAPDDAREGEEGTEELSGFSIEADCIAKRIKKLMEGSQKVFDKQSGRYRPLTYRDIVILMRSAAGKADLILDALRSNNIPAYAALSSGYFAETEIRVMLALLQIIDNPRQDIPLAAVLHSPIVNFSTEELAQIRLNDTEGELFDALLKTGEPHKDVAGTLKDKAAEFLQNLNRWRTVAKQLSVPELIWQLYDETGYYDYCGAMPGGVLRQANLRMLYDRAAAYEETDYRGLFRFLLFVGKMQKSGNDLSVARTLGENEDVVRIMTIHKSKGLEFPVVIIADMGKRINLVDSRQVLLIHKKYGLGPYVYDLQYNVRYPTVARQAIARQTVKESKAEELRVLYVGMTRAREKLILTGTVSSLAKKAAVWCQAAGEAVKTTLPVYQILNAGTYLDWLCPALARHADGTALYELCDSSRTETSPLPYGNSEWKIEIRNNTVAAPKEKNTALPEVFEKIRTHQPLSGTAAKAWVEERLNWQYSKAAGVQLPSKLSVTEIKRRFEPEPDTENIFSADEYARPRFLQEKTAMTGIEYGTLMHSVMQHLDLKKDLTDKGIQIQLEEMAEREIIEREQIKRVNRQSVQKFFCSSVGRRLLKSPLVRREMQFSRMLEAQRFYADAQPENRIFTQGVIDLLFTESDGLVLVDYKTDNCSGDEAAVKYKMQIKLYSEAVEAILTKPVKEKYLYLFHSGEIVPLK